MSIPKGSVANQDVPFYDNQQFPDKTYQKEIKRCLDHEQKEKVEMILGPT